MRDVLFMKKHDFFEKRNENLFKDMEMQFHQIRIRLRKYKAKTVT